MSRLKGILRKLAYKYPVFFDQGRQIVRILRSQFRGISYPRYVGPSSQKPLKIESSSLQLNSNVNNFLFFVHWFEVGGAESFALSMMKHLKAQNKKVYAFSTVPSKNAKIDWFKESADLCMPLPETMSQEKWLDYILNFISENQIDCIYVHHSTFAYENLKHIKTRFPHLRIIDSTHITEANNGGFVHMSAKHTDEITQHHVITPSLRDYYVYELGVLPEKILFFPLSYMSTAIQTDPLKTPYDAISKDIKFVFLGRVSQQKRAYLFVAIAKRLIPQLLKRELNPKFELYGDGPQIEIVKNQIKKYKLEKYVKIMGEVHDKNVIFKDAFALILPSENEGLPLVYFEATRLSVFSFCTDTGQTSDFLSEAFTTPQLSPFELAQKILKSLDQRDQYLAEFKKQKNRLNEFDQFTLNTNTIELFLYGTNSK